jgi:hypothetical protein
MRNIGNKDLPLHLLQLLEEAGDVLASYLKEHPAHEQRSCQDLNPVFQYIFIYIYKYFYLYAFSNLVILGPW